MGVQNTSLSKGPQTIAVYDLGGGTFDVSILRLTPKDDGEGADFFEVVSTAGDTRLGGDDVDRLIINLILDRARAQFGDDIPTDTSDLPPEVRQALRNFAEGAKLRLSEADAAPLRLDLGGGQALEHTLTRMEFDSLITPWVDRSIDRCALALRDAKMQASDIDRVVMVGGSTRVPLVRARVAEFFDTEPYTALDPDTVVALGAAVQGSIVSGADRSRLLLDVLPLSLGIETSAAAWRSSSCAIRWCRRARRRCSRRASTGRCRSSSRSIRASARWQRTAESWRSSTSRASPRCRRGCRRWRWSSSSMSPASLSVRAHERRSGKRAVVQVVPNHGLSRDEVERMETDAYANARDDMTRHRVADLVTNAKLDVKWINEAIARVEDELDESDLQDIRDKQSELQRLLAIAENDWKQADAEAIAKAKQSLDEASVVVHEKSIAKSLRE